jgi:hypothetical protein
MYCRLDDRNFTAAFYEQYAKCAQNLIYYLSPYGGNGGMVVIAVVI